MKLTRLLNEIELLYRCEARYGFSARKVVAQLVIDYIYDSWPTDEPPAPRWVKYRWPKSGRS